MEDFAFLEQLDPENGTIINEAISIANGAAPGDQQRASEKKKNLPSPKKGDSIKVQQAASPLNK